jgi:hypothetical protein
MAALATGLKDDEILGHYRCSQWSFPTSTRFCTLNSSPPEHAAAVMPGIGLAINE